MKYTVLVKQVPDVSQMQFDPETRRLRREGVRLEVSSFDVRALVRALELRAVSGGEVVVMTMGPPQARDALLHCLALGADRGLHLVDPAFAGADTLATARALALALRRDGFDLVLCGRSSVDAETGQVGPEVAELLDVAQITAVRRLEIDAKRRRVKAERETDGGFEAVECQLPALVSAAEDLAAERFPKRVEKEAAKQKPITELGARELSPDVEQFGAAGSPTRVEAIESVEVRREARIIEGELAEAVHTLAALLAERGLLAPAAPEKRASMAPRRTTPAERAKAIWALCETSDGRLRRVSLELIGKAIDLAAKTGGEVVGLLLGYEVRSHAAEISAHGADRVLVCDDPLLVDYSTDAYAAVLADAIRARQPRSVLLPATWLGRDLAPRVAARLGLGLTGDVIDLTVDAEGRLVQWKPAFGGNVVAPILSRTIPEMATVRPGMFEISVPERGRTAVVEELRLSTPPPIRTLVTERLPCAGIERAEALDDCRVAIGIGMGLGGADQLAQIEPLAEALGATAVAATRDVTDAGWLPRQHQVGLTGRAISPELYVAIGIRGAFEHMVGVRKARMIVAVNKNAKAPIFAQADFGLVADWTLAVPLLVREIGGLKNR
jgi:electron transfer flavoprotein alpha subunit